MTLNIFIYHFNLKIYLNINVTVIFMNGKRYLCRIIKLLQHYRSYDCFEGSSKNRMPRAQQTARNARKNLQEKKQRKTLN